MNTQELRAEIQAIYDRIEAKLLEMKPLLEDANRLCAIMESVNRISQDRAEAVAEQVVKAVEQGDLNARPEDR